MPTSRMRAGNGLYQLNHKVTGRQVSVGSNSTPLSGEQYSDPWSLWRGSGEAVPHAVDSVLVRNQMEEGLTRQSAQSCSASRTELRPHTGLVTELGEQEVSGVRARWLPCGEKESILAPHHRRVYLQSSSSVSMHRPMLLEQQVPEPR